ncbi:MAG TPA: hypothetical protein VFI27_10670 [candidate division Zixibacteria bacterium]|nr:hypothetical protein [candidate division Zixibacteria bacterium]
MTDTDKSAEHWWFSDAFLGAMLVLLTAATAFAGYQSTITSIKGDDFDIDSQKTLVAATGSFLNSNAELMQDIQSYDSYRFFSAEDPTEATVYLNRMSDRLQNKLDQPGGPFDDAYLAATYAEAESLLAHVETLEDQANQMDDRTQAYELAGFIFAIGLAAIAWASLVHTNLRIRLIFQTIALVCLLIGASVFILSP